MRTLNAKKFEIPSLETYKLDGIRKIALSLGHPELGRPTILVAGTNGKGSVCAYLSVLAKFAGLKVGTYSSPHVIAPEERIRINNKPISRGLLQTYERRYFKILSGLTFFERWTILAFLIFRDLKVNLQIIEVGMGGRLDATNICEPDVSVIASIDYDHQEVLGKTLSKISFEKAGIMRAGRPVILHPQVSEVRRMLRNSADDRQAEIVQSERWKIPSNLSSHFWWIRRDLGEHQFQNARSALLSWEIFSSEVGISARISVAQMKRALSRESLWPGRVEIVSRNPFILVDGAHNPHALKALVRFLKNQPIKKWNLIFGMMADKNAAEAIECLRPFATRVLLPSYYPEREFRPQDLKALWKRARVDAEVVKDIQSALRLVRNSGSSENRSILVAGSFYLAGAALSQLRK